MKRAYCILALAILAVLVGLLILVVISKKDQDNPYIPTKCININGREACPI